MADEAPRFLAATDWAMFLGERAALEGVLSFLQPRVAIEIGVSSGGSLDCVSRHSHSVHAFDLVPHEDLTPERFPNVTFHFGDSHALLPKTLDALAADGVAVDFVLVDGDHSSRGVRRDIEDLLDSPCTANTVMLLHDTLNERVRAGIRAVPFASYEKVSLIDLDFVPGTVVAYGPEHRSSTALHLFGGFGIVVTGWRAGDRPMPAGLDMLEVVTAYLAGHKSERIEAPSYWAFAEVEDEIATMRESMRKMERSLSWRITSPLRGAKSALKRDPSAEQPSKREWAPAPQGEGPSSRRASRFSATVRRQRRFLVPLLGGIGTFAATAALVEGFTDRDWSLSGLEWPTDFVTAALLVCLVPLLLWLLQLLLNIGSQRLRASRAEPSNKS